MQTVPSQSVKIWNIIGPEFRSALPMSIITISLTRQVMISMVLSTQKNFLFWLRVVHLIAMSIITTLTVPRTSIATFVRYMRIHHFLFKCTLVRYLRRIGRRTSLLMHPSCQVPEDTYHF